MDPGFPSDFSLEIALYSAQGVIAGDARDREEPCPLRERLIRAASL